VAVAGQYLRFAVGKLGRGCLVAVQRPRLSDEMNRRYDVCEGLAQFGKTGIDDDILAVPEPYAVKVACAVLWGGTSGDAAPLPANRVNRASARSRGTG
jgi:hypothetical protein